MTQVYINGQWLNKLLVQNGLAWVYGKYALPMFVEWQKEARLRHIGIWKQSNPMPPYQYRKFIKNKI